MPGKVGFERVWHFRVAAGAEPEFERQYGSAGAWAQLFGSAAGFVGTELQCLDQQPSEYLVIDRWESRGHWEAFRAAHGAAYERLDRACEALTTAEELVRETDTAAPEPG